MSHELGSSAVNPVPRRGVVFAAVGDRHVIMARRAARALRLVCPNVPIDLFTDADLDDPIFARIHKVERIWRRPKIEALRRSRFERTLYLDSDIITVSDGLDLLDLLDRADIVGVHDNSRNAKNARATAGRKLPNAFPSINSGVLAVRHNARTQDLLRSWEIRMDKAGHNKDQPALRSVLWEKDVRLAIAPIEYNLMHQKLILTLNRVQAAPRFLHAREINHMQRDLGDPNTPYRIEEIFSWTYCLLLKRALHADRTVPKQSPIAALPGSRWARLFVSRYYRLTARSILNARYRADIARREKRRHQAAVSGRAPSHDS